MSDPFPEFRNAVTRYFGPLAADFSLGPATEKVYLPEIYVEFADATRRVIVSREASSDPWVVVHVSDRGRDLGFGLHTLVADVEDAFDTTETIAALATIDEKVRVLAELTRRYAGALLNGDLRRVPQLRQLQAKFHRERKLREMGTRSGLTPRGYRPSLKELFASARGAEYPADVRMHCIYEAVWDHDYPIEEVASFLRLPPADVQRIVDALDNVDEENLSLDALRRIVGRG